MPDKKIQKIRQKIVKTLKKEGVLRAAIFGSVARGKARKTSDIDILVQLKKGKTLFDLSGLQLELQRILGREVDVVEYEALHPLLKERILSEQVLIL